MLTFFYGVFQMMFIAFLPFIVILLLFGIIKFMTTRKVDLNGKHVLITGGSSGIGKSLACEAARRGAHVTIAARNQAKLDEAVKEIFQAVRAQEQKIQTVSVDISSNYEEMKEKLLASEKVAGPVFMLVNCAGTAVCGILDDVTEDQIKSQFSINTIGSILPTKAVLSGMKERRSGHIVLVASQAAYVGIYGLAVYSASKIALRGFAEALNMELVPYGVKVTVSYPPDTDTPGYQEEQKTKPKETKLISEASGLFQPDQVAKKILNDALAGRFSSNIGVDGFILEHLGCGMSPFQTLFDFAFQVFFLGVFRFTGILYNLYFQRVVKNCYLEKNKPTKQE